MGLALESLGARMKHGNTSCITLKTNRDIKVQFIQHFIHKVVSDRGLLHVPLLQEVFNRDIVLFLNYERKSFFNIKCVNCPSLLPSANQVLMCSTSMLANNWITVSFRVPPPWTHTGSVLVPLSSWISSRRV